MWAKEQNQTFQELCSFLCRTEPLLLIRTGPHKQYTSWAFLLISYNLVASHRIPNINVNMTKPYLKLHREYTMHPKPQKVLLPILLEESLKIQVITYLRKTLINKPLDFLLTSAIFQFYFKKQCFFFLM